MEPKEGGRQGVNQKKREKIERGDVKHRPEILLCYNVGQDCRWHEYFETVCALHILRIHSQSTSLCLFGDSPLVHSLHVSRLTSRGDTSGSAHMQWRQNADSRREVNRQTGAIVEGSIQGDSMNLVCSDSLRNLTIFQRGDQPCVMSIMLYWRTNYSQRRQFWCFRPRRREHRRVRTSLLGNVMTEVLYFIMLGKIVPRPPLV